MINSDSYSELCWIGAQTRECREAGGHPFKGLVTHRLDKRKPLSDTGPSVARARQGRNSARDPKRPLQLSRSRSEKNCCICLPTSSWFCWPQRKGMLWKSLDFSRFLKQIQVSIISSRGSFGKYQLPS